jgi:hypothetical protein
MTKMRRVAVIAGITCRRDKAGYVAESAILLIVVV